MIHVIQTRTIIIFSALLLAVASPFSASPAKNYTELKDLNVRTNSDLIQLRQDVRDAIYIVKSGRDESELPKLAFYNYKVKTGDTFWNILARSSMDIDTLLSVNDLSSPGDVKKGMRLFIPNMRGIVADGTKHKELYSKIKECGTHKRYVLKVNRTNAVDKKYIFIPGGKITRLQRSLFLGTGFMHPTKIGVRSSGFGTRLDPFDKKEFQFHRGIDIACPMKTRVRASREGVVSFCGYKGGYGNLVIISHEHGYKSYYGHLHNSLVKAGQKVDTGDIIALSGNTGRTTGPHLHFEIRRGNKALNPALMIHR